MQIRKLPPVTASERSKDELLAERITAFFVGAAPFPSEHGFALTHDGPPPTVYGKAWQLEWTEDWCVHELGTVYYDVSATGDFSTAGAAAILVTQKFVRLMLGAGGPGKPQGFMLAVRGDGGDSTHLDRLIWRFVELSDIGAGDLLVLHHWKLKRLVLRVPWARSVAALITGLRATERQPNALENGVVNPRNRARLEGAKPGDRTLEVRAKDEPDS